MPSAIETVETQIVTLLNGISYLQTANGGTVRGVSDIKTFLNLQSIGAPAAIVVFDGERAKENEEIGASLQQTQFYWTLYLLARSFGSASEGRLTQGAVKGAYAMLDDVIGALEGQLITMPQGNTKLFYVGSARYDVMPNAIVYDSKWRHQYVRTGA